MTGKTERQAAPGERDEAIEKCICPVSRRRCMGDSCMWYVSYAAGAKGCAATHVADALVEVAFQMTLD